MKSLLQRGTNSEAYLSSPTESEHFKMTLLFLICCVSINILVCADWLVSVQQDGGLVT